MKRTLLLLVVLAAACGNPVTPTDTASSDGTDTQTADGNSLVDTVLSDVRDSGTDVQIDVPQSDVAQTDVRQMDTAADAVALDTRGDTAADVSTDAPRDVPADVAVVDVVLADVSADITVSDSSGSGDACTKLTSDDSAIGNSCTPGTAECPTGYTCQPFNGIVLTHSCQILCEDNCQCPSTTVCAEAGDKGSMWHQCATP